MASRFPGAARFDPPQQGRAEGTGDDADRQGFTSVNVGLRKALDLYANLRPVEICPASRAVSPDVDLVIVRENTEDLYAGLDTNRARRRREPEDHHREGSTRIAQFAFEHARRTAASGSPRSTRPTS